ncbi:MAG: helix-turn-helix domain-containing protein [Dehalococcoidia bacterium]|nr:helix-turn-helix domain-containing protein [Dehalococcoidia bacterium]
MMSTLNRNKKSVLKEKAPSPMLTISEACRLLNIHSNTLRRWGAKGLIKEFRIGPGCHRRFRAEDVAALIMDQPKYRQSRANRLSRH